MQIPIPVEHAIGDVDEIDEIWQYYAHLSFSDSKILFNNMVEEKLNEIQEQLRSIDGKL